MAMIKECKISAVLLLLMAGILTACSDRTSVPVPEPVPDARMALSVSFHAGKKSIGDPGSGHDEWTDNWKTMGIYMVYTDGRVENFRVTKAELTNPLYFNVFEGEVTVCAAAFPDGQEPPFCATPDEVFNMKTTDVTVLSDRQKFMQNVFGGVSSRTVIAKDKENIIDVTCNRIVSKVDVQWDVQPGIEAGKFLDARMSAIQFKGRPQGYLFPTLRTETPATSETAEIVSLESHISERNGRTYAYMFPEEFEGETRLGFTINYTKQDNPVPKSVNYDAWFKNKLEGNSWYKVNLLVRGNSVSVENLAFEIGAQ